MGWKVWKYLNGEEKMRCLEMSFLTLCLWKERVSNVSMIPSLVKSSVWKRSTLRSPFLLYNTHVRSICESEDSCSLNEPEEKKYFSFQHQCPFWHNEEKYIFFTFELSGKCSNFCHSDYRLSLPLSSVVGGGEINSQVGTNTTEPDKATTSYNPLFSSKSSDSMTASTGQHRLNLLQKF